MSPEKIRAQEELQPTGDTIRTTRNKANLKQKELAVYCGLHYNHFGRVERGANNLDLLTLVKTSFAVQLPVFRHLRLPANAIRRKRIPTDVMVTRRLRRVLKIIGDNILHQLELKNMSQEDLAREMGVDRSEINRYAHGLVNMQYATLVRIAMHLEVETQGLLTP